MNKKHVLKSALVECLPVDTNELIYNETEVYAYINKTDGDLLDISIITESLLEYDKKMLTKDNCANYKPYFLEFFCDAGQNESVKKLVHKYTGKWIEAKLQNCTDEDNPDVINGTLLISMSPFKRRRKGLIYNENELDAEKIKQLEEKYKIDHNSILLKNEEDANYTKLRECLNIHSLSDNYKIRVYNVGQGNCIYLRDSSSKEITKRVLFDIGVTITQDVDIEAIKLRAASLSQIKPDIMILSHWDLDHLLGVYLVEEKSYADIWIAPDYEERKINQSIKRLTKYLCLNGKLSLIGDYFQGKIVYNSEILQIYKGKIKEKGYSAKNQIANNHGLMLLLKNKHGVDILPGDCEYDMWPDAIFSEICGKINLVVPHHCGEMETTKMEDICKKTNPSNAIISVGDNTYGHPNPEHKCALCTMGYRIVETRDNKWIDISSGKIEVVHERQQEYG